jgi:hypothetical protein
MPPWGYPLLGVDTPVLLGVRNDLLCSACMVRATKRPRQSEPAGEKVGKMRGRHRKKADSRKHGTQADMCGQRASSDLQPSTTSLGQDSLRRSYLHNTGERTHQRRGQSRRFSFLRCFLLHMFRVVSLSRFLPSVSRFVRSIWSIQRKMERMRAFGNKPSRH